MGQRHHEDRAGRAHRSRPSLESLEGRQLLSVAPTATLQADASAKSSSPNLQVFKYKTPSGGTATIQIQGRGTLEGTTAPGGVLNLVYSKTNANTKIIGSVKGGNGTAPLATIRYKNLSIENLSGVGGSVLKTASLKQFNLIDNGNINLTSGVDIVYLNSIGANTQVHLRYLPETIPASDTAGSASDTTNNVSNNIITDVFLVQSLAGSSGEFLTAGNIVNESVAGHPGAPPAPPGIILKVNRIKGNITNPPNLLTDAEIFGYDATTNRLIRFNTATGDPNLTIQVPGTSPMVGGAALSRNAGHLDVVVSDGTTVYAFNAVTGAAEGSFTVTNLGLTNFTGIDALGSTDATLVIGDSNGGAQNAGILQEVDLTQSLIAGQAVPKGAAYTPQNQFTTTGGLAGVPGSVNIFAAGAAHFNTFQPDQVQLGYLTLSTYTFNTSATGTTFTNRLSETARTAIQPYTNVDLNQPADQIRGQALGSVDQALAAVTGLVYDSNGQPVANRVGLVSTISLSNRGTIQLKYPNLLTGLSEAFRPDLAGSALIDIQGNVQSIRGRTATGMVINDTGNLNLVQFDKVTNSTILAQPFGHAKIAHRKNVSIVSSPRDVDGRGGVTIVKNLRVVGPLSLPDDGSR
ncbi:MAG: hypothetical protein ABS79_04880 [Planctomycetes bacterium SCN 63-9]|nr:MAG: hypothetical protein ABS79_04880 [Planctomycetes bacterium SCN 63-9]